MEEIYALYNSDTRHREENIKEFFRLWNSFESLNRVKNWWNNISIGISLTPIGKSLAHANAQRYFYGILEFHSK